MHGKRIVSLVFALVLCLALFPAVALGAESDFTIVGQWLLEYNGPGGEVVIPEGVTQVNASVFAGHAVTSVTIPASLTDENSVLSMFYDCPSLSAIDVASGNPVYTAWDGVLYSRNMTQIVRCPEGKNTMTIPSSVTKIGNRAFRNCANLSSVALPTSLTEIGDAAFLNCTGLESILILGNVRTVGNYAFDGCEKLTYVGMQTGVTQIGECAFRSCSSLTTIALPDSVQSVGGGAFKGCTALKKVTLPKGLTTIENAVFSDCGELTDVVIPEGVTEIGPYAFEKCRKLPEINIPDGVTGIGTYAFSYCQSLSDVTLPEGLTSIDRRAFQYCTGLSGVTIPGTVTSIGEDPFYGCSALERMTFAPGTKEVGGTVFNGCSALRRVILPDTLTKVTPSTFSGVERDIHYAGDEQDWINVENAEYLWSTMTVHYNSTGPLPLLRTFFTIDTTPETFTGAPINKTIVGRDGDKLLVEDEDYDVVYTDNTNVGEATITITGLHAYEGTVRATFQIGPARLTEKMFQVRATAETYTGDPIAKAVYSTYGLVKDTDYTVSYEDNINAGTAKVILTGKGRYEGTLEYPFTIEPKVLTEAMLSVDTEKEFYTGLPLTKTVTGQDGERALTQGVDYQVTYTNNTNLGVAGLTVSGMGNYKGERSYSFPIRSTSPQDEDFVYSNGMVSRYVGVDSDVVIPDGVTGIASYAFYSLPVETITIPASAKKVHDSPFFSCADLASVQVAQDNENYASEDGVLFNKDKTELIFYPPARTETAYTVPGTVTTIRDSAFQECQYLTQVTLPEGVTTVGMYAFSSCDALSEVYLPQSLTTLYFHAFYSREKLDVYYAGSEEDWTQVLGHMDPELESDWLVLHYNYGKFAPASGQLQGEGRSLGWTVNESGEVTLTGGPEAEEMVWLACYDAQGRLESVARLTEEAPMTRLRASCARGKLLWLDASLRPLSASAVVWEE
ncbi:MAG: leucine-rich repeat domain-containing protein [Muribaculaceae bacterium]|nr:leucine-rich repeat domain-containing protein [Muribaculaceae bacterium]